MTAPQAIGEYPQYERLLWRVLAVLARSGYFVPPQDARDLLHDFYLEGWNGVKERFDPKLSSFATYLSAAFYRFARRRIANMESWRHRLVDIDEASAIPSATPAPHEHIEHTEQLVAITRAMQRLPELERQVLYAYAGDHAVAERELAQRAGLSRYAVRELLTNAVGRLASEFKETNPDSTDSLVAFYLWQDDRTPRQVASLLGLPVSEVQAARTRVATQLLSSIRALASSRHTQGATMPYTAEQLKIGLLAREFDEACKFIADHAEEFRAAVESDTEFAFTEAESAFLAQNPERLGRVYELLGASGDDEADERTELAQALAHSRNNADREIGEAFHALVGNLPERLRNWNEAFGSVRSHITSTFQSHLMQEPSVKYGGPLAVEITQYGLTPSSIHEATVAIQLLLDRVERQSRTRVPDEFSVAKQRESRGGMLAHYSNERTAFIEAPYFYAQLQGVRDMPIEAVRPLMEWLLNAATVFPYLFADYRVDEQPTGTGLQFVHQPSTYQPGLEPELFRQWTRRRPELSASSESSLKPRMI